jgi:hypothetical protein
MAGLLAVLLAAEKVPTIGDEAMCGELTAEAFVPALNDHMKLV